MKRLVFASFCVLLCLTISSQNLRIATYNLRFDNPGDSLDLWKNRSPFVAGLIQLFDFDVFGTQEGLKHQLEDLKNDMPGYDYIGVGRDDGKEKGEHAAIFFKTGRFKLLDEGTFWLSAITDRPNKGWDAALPRICTWGKFEELTSGKTFYLFNTHFDHIGVTARRESAKLIISMIRTTAGNSACILTGDFNFDETNENYALIKESGFLADTYDLAGLRFAPNGTFNAFNIASKPVGRIDHIFVTRDFSVIRYGILTNTYNGRCPSDHFPVFAEVRL
jgi:endonuclease/exonuclease/phosphatase family metal-dependent hydrolase